MQIIQHARQHLGIGKLAFDLAHKILHRHPAMMKEVRFRNQICGKAFQDMVLTAKSEGWPTRIVMLA
ncbi:hypothetical protein D3C76_1341950 [compost metagenome]